MFGLFRPKSKPLPPLDAEMIATAEEAKAWCLSQIGEFVGKPVALCPLFSSLDDERIAAYTCGFIAGYLQVTKVDARWSNGDGALSDMGHIALCGIVLVGVIGPDRFQRVMPALPGWGNAKPDLVKMDACGGADGMAHAERRDKSNGGLLLHYLRCNVAMP